MRKTTLFSMAAFFALTGFSHNSAAQSIWADCNNPSLYIGDQRFHVKCNAPYKGKTAAFQGDVPYRAMSLNDNPVKVAAMINTIATAIANNKKLRVRFNSDVKKNPKGCKGSDCRKLEAVIIR